MVFFTCDSCGESLKKVQVEKHLLKCRSCQVLSCIDCGADFRGDDYKSHNRCISEDQKYGGRDFQAKANKGDLKQQQWIERVQEAVSRPDVGSELQQVLRRLSVYENVPRKRAKFENWMRNCLKIHSPLLLKQVWEILSVPADSGNRETLKDCESRAELKNGTKENRDQRNRKKNRKTSEEHNGHEKQTKKKRKREQDEQNTDQTTNKRQKKSKQEVPDESLNEEGEEPDNQEPEPNTTAGKFNWKGTIKAVLRDAPEDGLAVKKLRKKVLAAYYSFSGDRNYRSEEELLSLFNRKINTNPKFKILKDRVRLLK